SRKAIRLSTPSASPPASARAEAAISESIGGAYRAIGRGGCGIEAAGVRGPRRIARLRTAAVEPGSPGYAVA
ncbi:hypothetical protein RCK87_25690, partial [Salmonella enterica subsp. enterica serovar 1,4,[5],12:i:-]